ncbi:MULTISPECIES: helix-turn-helix transcriptional regulator [unclassified Nocardiopsis]|uniref:helix-turn-helix domain-containing protein n=1 Tax=unclassified Nocardiopsis TaxID=2649073 RepID=UPI00135A67BE|nr:MULTISPECIES: helix-turn-helix transcriptional regulator [unclassified Nocardiopsis]
MRSPNVKLKAVIAELGWSQQQVAARFLRVAREMRQSDLLGVGRSTISMWVTGTRPQGRAPEVLCETLSRGLGRPLSLEDIGLGRPDEWPTQSSWEADTLAALAELGSDVHRRQFIGTAVYSVAGLTLPGESWWRESVDRARARPAKQGVVTRGDVEAIQDATRLFQRLDQQRGGGYGASAATMFLTEEVLPALRRRAPDRIRSDLFAAASELVYVLGWSSFDANRHGTAQRFLQLSVKLAAEAGDRALAGHVLRALAHQAMDLGHFPQAAKLTSASIDCACYRAAGPRERALLGVVHARSLAAVGEHKASAKALLIAENDLADAGEGDDEPGRVWFFTQASLAHETARTLQVMGDLGSAEREFKRSVRLRPAEFSRTHAVTLGYLGEIQAARGEIEAACATWTEALDAMEGVRSGRARNTVQTMRTVLSSVRGRGIDAVREVDSKAAEMLRVA